MRQDQHEAYDHIVKCEMIGPLRGGILCLKMGLGKTRIILYTIEKEIGSGRKTLIVCSKTVLGEWLNECEKWVPHLKVLPYHRELYSNYNKLTKDDIHDADIIMTTYDVIRSIDSKFNCSDSICIRGDEGIYKDKIIGFKQKLKPDFEDDDYICGPQVLYAFPWYRLVTDESQKFCNYKTNLFKAVCSLYSQKRWCLTGTPIRNHEHDMWSLLFYCGLTTPDNPKKFNYNIYLKYKDVIIIRDYKHTSLIMPKIIYHEEYLDFSQPEYQVYEFYLTQLWDAYDKFIQHDSAYAFDNGGFALILGLFTRLRQICIAPYLITSESKRKTENEKCETDLAYQMPQLELYVHNKELAGFTSSKILKILDIISKISESDKIVIFSSFTACLDLLYDILRQKYKCIIVDGSVSGKRRYDRLNDFRQKQDYRILLINFKVGGEGLNLPEANHVICVELWWSPVVISQAISRCWRVGQTKEVHAYKFIISKSIEETMNTICLAKDSISNQYLNGDINGRQNIPKLDKFTLGQIIGYYH